jgi:hypothetical protein
LFTIGFVRGFVYGGGRKIQGLPGIVRAATILRNGGREAMIIAGCLLIGVGLGMVFGHTGAGALIGLGAGFLLEFFWSRGKRKES